MKETNLLNYYNKTNKNHVELIGYLYDISDPINFKNNSKIDNNLEFYCLKLFAVKLNKEWLYTKGFVKVAINKTPLGSIVRLKGVLSKQSILEDTNILNLIKFRKIENNWIIEPIKPQKVNESNFKMDMYLDYKTFCSIPICYNQDKDDKNKTYPTDMENRKPIVYTKNINSNLKLNSYRERPITIFEPYVFNQPKVPSLYLRLLNEFYYFNRIVLSIGRLNEIYKETIPVAIDWVIESIGYSKSPSKQENFCYIQDNLIVKSVPYIELQNVIV